MKNRSDFFNSVENTTISETPIKPDSGAKKAVGRTALFLIYYHIIMVVVSVLAMGIAIEKTGEYFESTLNQNIRLSFQ